jgi:hypothetical protein
MSTTRIFIALICLVLFVILFHCVVQSSDIVVNSVFVQIYVASYYLGILVCFVGITILLILDSILYDIRKKFSQINGNKILSLESLNHELVNHISK